MTVFVSVTKYFSDKYKCHDIDTKIVTINFFFVVIRVKALSQVGLFLPKSVLVMVNYISQFLKSLAGKFENSNM